MTPGSESPPASGVVCGPVSDPKLSFEGSLMSSPRSTAISLSISLAGYGQAGHVRYVQWVQYTAGS